jgi:hypothetical protein
MSHSAGLAARPSCGAQVRAHHPVNGCSPGCLLVSIVLSVFLTLAVNSCLHLVG